MVEARLCALTPRTLAAACVVAFLVGPTYAQSCLDGDSDLDTDVDLVDVASIQRCFSPNGGPIPDGCNSFDFGGNDSIGLDDFAMLAGAMTEDKKG